MRLLVPPGFKTIHGELWGVVGGPDEDCSEIWDGQIDAVGDGDALCIRRKVVVHDGTRLQRPLLAVVLEERDLFSLL